MRYIQEKTKLLALVLATVLTASQTSSYATELEEGTQSVEDLKEEQKNAQNALDALGIAKQQLMDTLGDMNSDLFTVSNSIADSQEQIASKEQEIQKAQEELDDATKLAQEQYCNMKKRIQFFYENGSRSIWMTLLESGSVSEFIDRVKYVTDVSDYDRNMLTTYQKTQDTVAEYKRQLEQQKAELLSYQDELSGKEDQLNSLIASKQEELSDTNEEQENKQQEVDDLGDKIAAMEEYERKLEEEKAAQDAANLAMIKQQEEELKRQQEEWAKQQEELKRQQEEEQKRKQEEQQQQEQQEGENPQESETTELEDNPPVITNPNVVNASESETYLLAAIIACEAEGEPYQGQLAVGSVVLNRVNSSYFPNTITEVIYQNNQFSPVASGRLALKLESGVNSSCMNAAKEVLAGNRTVSCLYFRVNNGLIDGTVIGNHVFY